MSALLVLAVVAVGVWLWRRSRRRGTPKRPVSTIVTPPTVRLRLHDLRRETL